MEWGVWLYLEQREWEQLVLETIKWSTDSMDD